MNLNLSSKLPLGPRWFPWVLASIAFLGFADASYLAAKHYLGSPLVCFIFSDCNTVTASPYAYFLGIPVSLFGALYYLTVFILLVLFFDTKSPHWLRWATLITPIGFIASAWFVFVQAFILESYCLYCLLSALTSTLLAALSAWWWIQFARNETLSPSTPA